MLQPKQIAFTVALAFLTVPFAAQASVITTANTAFNLSKSVTDTLQGSPTQTVKSDGNTTTKNFQLGTSQVTKFDASKGVLTGVNVKLVSTQTQSADVTAASSGQAGTMNSGTASGTGSSSISLTIPTNVKGAQSSLTATDSCSKNNEKTGCSNGATSASVNDNVTVGSNQLNAYVGDGTSTFTVTHMLDSISAETTATNFTGLATTTSTVTWAGNLSAAYTYADHAAAAFLGTSGTQLALDFGSVYLGDTVKGIGFSLANLLGDRVALSLTSFVESGDTANQFSTNLAAFSNLAAGSSKAFEADFLASAKGQYSASYLLTFADYAPDAASTTLSSGSTLLLKVQGNVLDKPVPAAVPEPASLMLLGLGIAGLGLGRKRRQR